VAGSCQVETASPARSRNHTGATLRNLVLAAIEYWSAYGLRNEVLSDICTNVFGLKVD